VTRAGRAGIALAAACFWLGAGSAALAKSSKHHHHHHQHKSHNPASGGAVGDAKAEGKAHLKRANELAGDGDCAAAIAEYTKAYELLNDPVVLFNRGECYRRTGDGEAAADDYHAFLDKVPNAPNRADIEAKLVALEAPEPSKREKPAAEPPPPPKTAEAPPRAAPPPPPAAPKVESKPAPAVAIQKAPVPEESAPSGGSRPWVWVALSVLVVGTGVAGYLVFRPHDQPPPETALGNYRF
jgi:tetratricopeptide (TPR) repeat protein